jgi:hypothetical protein
MQRHPTLAAWHRMITDRTPQALDDILAEEAVFYSPVVHAAQVGKAITAKYLAAAFHVFLNGSFLYVREIADERGAVLEFEVEIDGIQVNGVDMMKWNDAGKIVDFKVLIRPIKAVMLVHEKMAAMLQMQGQR